MNKGSDMPVFASVAFSFSAGIYLGLFATSGFSWDKAWSSGFLLLLVCALAYGLIKLRGLRLYGRSQIGPLRRREKTELKEWLQNAEIQAQIGDEYLAVLKGEEFWLVEIGADSFLAEAIFTFRPKKALERFAVRLAARRAAEEKRKEKLNAYLENANL